MLTVNRRKGQKGFTLVEVIVVAVIVAALAAVAIPLYLGYVDSSRKNAAANAAGSIASFCGSCVNTSSTNILTPASGEVTGTLNCSNGTAIQIPSDVKVTLLAGTPGDLTATPPVPATNRAVKAIHTSSAQTPANEVKYNY